MVNTLRGTPYRTLLLALVTTCTMAGADVVFDNGGPGLDNAWFSGYTTGSWYEVYDDFVLAPGVNAITDIHWWGVYKAGPPAQDDFVIAIFEDIAGERCASFWPDGLLTVYRPGPVSREFVLHDTQRLLLENAGDEAPVDLFAYEYVLPEPLTLTAGKTYWLTIINRTIYLAPNMEWHWESNAAATGNGLWLADGIGCDYTGGGLAFRLTGPRVIPEPASVSLLALGLLTWFGARRHSVNT